MQESGHQPPHPPEIQRKRRGTEVQRRRRVHCKLHAPALAAQFRSLWRCVGSGTSRADPRWGPRMRAHTWIAC
eukprot:scaffold318833_cov21-Tisochrysis_lutea.AAC.2